jgi:hypothetical protein
LCGVTARFRDRDRITWQLPPLKLQAQELDVASAIEEGNRFQTCHCSQVPHRQEFDTITRRRHTAKNVEKIAKTHMCSATNLHVMGISKTRRHFL